MANPMTFTNIVDAVEEIVKKPGGSQATMIGYLVNMVYLNEVMNMDEGRPLFWLLSPVINRRSISPIAITSISVANPGVISCASGHGMVAGDIGTLYGISGMTQANGMQFTVASVASTSITADINTTGFTAWSSGGYVYHRGITLAANVQRLLSVSWNDESAPMRPMTPDQYERDTTNHNLDNTGLPHSYTHLQAMNASTGAQTDKILWTPGADQSYLMRYWGVAVVDRMSGSNYPLLPAQFHDAIVAGVVARMTEVKDPRVNIENATLWPSIYTAQLEAIRSYNDKWWTNIDNRQVVRNFLA